jgi:hypothetical protein
MDDEERYRRYSAASVVVRYGDATAETSGSPFDLFGSRDFCTVRR